MIEIAAGTATFHTRVDAWECDFNGHWNTKFYCRSFQTAAEVAAALDENANPETVVTTGRHLRFHSELHSGDPVEIRSFNAQADDGSSRIAHVLLSEGKLAATALDQGFGRNKGLPDLPRSLAAKVLPRGLPEPALAPWKTPDPGRDQSVELGPVMAREIHSDGTLRSLEVASRLAIASHHFAIGIGYTMGFTEQTAIGRMLVEMRYTRLGPVSPGVFLRGKSRFVSATDKSYVSAHLIDTHAQEPVAFFELCLLAVDMKTRQTTLLPDFVRKLNAE